MLTVDNSIVRPDIRTISGNYFNFLEPTDNAVLVSDIGHALSHVCRFAGHVSEFYSVAQHSYFCSFLVPPEDAMAALFHDATEAYIGDVTRPLKRLLPDYRSIEERLHADIFGKLGLDPVLPPSVKHADRVLLATEARDLTMHRPGDQDLDGESGIDPLPVKIIPWGPFVARQFFMERYRQLEVERQSLMERCRQLVGVPQAPAEGGAV